MLSWTRLEELMLDETPLPLTPLCRKIGQTKSNVSTPKVYPAYDLSVDKLGEITRVQNYTELFTSAVNVFSTVDPEVLFKAQHAQYGDYFKYLANPGKALSPKNETRYTMSYFFTQ
ncbi:unnamed protein product [Choristocarpus tenellus]